MTPQESSPQANAPLSSDKKGTVSVKQAPVCKRSTGQCHGLQEPCASLIGNEIRAQGTNMRDVMRRGMSHDLVNKRYSLYKST